ncbi:MAG: LD-carboxypeptidase [Ignavibacteriaceae bacterium]|nr:LD-carboxypeptidase [Ignavibacteriaceae bacterium]
MRRKNFIKSIAAASIGAAILPMNISNALGKKVLPVVKPKKLKTGDTIGLIAPGSFISEAELKESIDNLSALGFKVVYNDTILERYGYLAGKDKQRADDVNIMFARRDVDAIVTARGGYGCSRILPYLDYKTIINNPKILIGYSDITALLFGIYAKTGLVTFHGPVGISTFNDFSVKYFNDVLMSESKNTTLYNAAEDKEKGEFDVHPIVTGKGRGRLVGGNLSIVVSMIGTDYDVDYKDKIIFLEEIGEEPYRIDRMLTQMIESGKFENASGVMLGVFHNCEAKEHDPSFPISLSLKEVLLDRLGNLKIPVIYGMSFGHVTNKFTLPFGIEAELDSGDQTIKLLENAVI